MKGKIKTFAQNEPVKTALIGGSSLLVLLIAVLKRKSISKFLKNIFKKGGSSSSSSAGQTAQTAQQARAKIVLPKPNFTVGKENPEQFAKEKAEYINSIWDEFLDIRPPFKPMDKEKSILGLKALQQFGTREDLLKLHPTLYKIVIKNLVIKGEG